ncbi:exopolysaccharide biosynthesis protein [Leisingera sp. ANG-M7]|uniref:exopolysaccharide biosynthesis protein n=1 Tax=Leisingera sp. ANG-M7 TaxID=1577902 RepID=UPI0005808236|nr:exopolysaccharide biosynthesis protein [Leisingera sp. ANG-M7]KIC37915.1 exopolysaccharide biosynthesis protein exod [Leisingera sp. ANG-M7]
MTSAKQPVEHVLKETSNLARRNRGGITVSRFAEELGQSSLPAVLAVPAMAVVTPLSGVPLFSSACGALICLISAQMLMGRQHLWIPGWLGRRRIKADAVRKGAAALRGSVRWLDRHSGKRLVLLTRQPFLTVIQAVCLICGALMPLLEIVPFSSSVLGSIVSLLAVAMLTRDGLIALLTLSALFAAAAAFAAGLI